MMDSEYSEYAKLLSKVADTEKDLAKDKRELKELKDKIINNDANGEYAITVTHHAFKQIADRVEEVAYESPSAYKDIFGCPSEKSILRPSKLTAFIITMVCKAREDASFEKRSSRSGKYEYVYNINISKWRTDKELFFTCIVENNVVKTGYFNFVNGGS